MKKYTQTPKKRKKKEVNKFLNKKERHAKKRAVLQKMDILFKSRLVQAERRETRRRSSSVKDASQQLRVFLCKMTTTERLDKKKT